MAARTSQVRPFLESLGAFSVSEDEVVSFSNPRMCTKVGEICARVVTNPKKVISNTGAGAEYTSSRAKWSSTRNEQEAVAVVSPGDKTKKKEFGKKDPHSKKEFGKKDPHGKKEIGKKNPHGKKEFGKKDPHGKKEFGKKEFDTKEPAKKEFGKKERNERPPKKEITRKDATPQSKLPKAAKKKVTAKEEKAEKRLRNARPNSIPAFVVHSNVYRSASVQLREEHAELNRKLSCRMNPSGNPLLLGILHLLHKRGGFAPLPAVIEFVVYTGGLQQYLDAVMAIVPPCMCLATAL
jgi:hypothetical protein